MIGQLIIDAVIKANALDKAFVNDDGGTTFVWNACAAEQIEAALSESLSEAMPTALSGEVVNEFLSMIKHGTEAGDDPREAIWIALADTVFEVLGLAVPEVPKQA